MQALSIEELFQFVSILLFVRAMLNARMMNMLKNVLCVLTFFAVSSMVSADRTVINICFTHALFCMTDKSNIFF